MIDDILKQKKIGKLYNLLVFHSQRLGIRKDAGDMYSVAKDVLNNPKKWKYLIKKLKQYED